MSDDFNQVINTYQDPVITEFATLGLSCILLHERASLEITEVCRRGEKVDYWLGDRELLLEVSGQAAGNLESLRDQKAMQLRANPFEKPGFVCVANYTQRQAYLLYYTLVSAT